MPGAKRSQDFVDYERVAPRYEAGRSLPGEVLDRWGDVVRPYLPSRPLRVLDVGAGTGIFARAWPTWTPSTVVALEPSAAMIGTGVAVDASIRYVRGVAEALPIRDGGVDVLWVSTALHHFADVDRAADEARRVLAGRGLVLLRTHVPGRTEVTWAEEFPNRSRWEGRFHREEDLVALFGVHGFTLVDVGEVLEGTATYGESAQWVESMRHADSVLTALSNDDVARGLEVLRSQPAKLSRLELTLVVFERR